jgi:lipoprotein-anchoring transpeptidase ErfK/SrfK
MKHRFWAWIVVVIILLGGCMSRNIFNFDKQSKLKLTPLVSQITATSTTAPTATATATPTPTPNVYVVKEGETLKQIANRLNIPIGYLAEQNNIGNPDLIFPNQVITIPEWPLENMNPDNKLIVVILSEQKVYVYQNGDLLKTLTVSTGVAQYPTVTGNYQIEIKYAKTRMTGPGYDLPDVPWVMYFYSGYSFHGTYWHSNFGYPMSHGCINMTIPDAEWLYNWARVFTPVLIKAQP